jgi:hypothetical protein
VHIGPVAAHDCQERLVSDVDADGDHLLLTPDFNTINPNLVYSAEMRDFSDGLMAIQACNPRASLINDNQTLFNLLVIDAH